MKTQLTFRQEVQKAIKDLASISDARIAIEIARLERNLKNLQSDGSRIVVLPEYARLRKARAILVQVMHFREGYSLPETLEYV